jgi:hypothetical protein
MGSPPPGIKIEVNENGAGVSPPRSVEIAVDRGVPTPAGVISQSSLSLFSLLLRTCGVAPNTVVVGVDETRDGLAW